MVERVFVLCMGGFGFSFNVMKYFYVLYVQYFLLVNGVMFEDFLDLVLSVNMVEDVVLLLKQFNDLGIEEVFVVSLDYYIFRVKFIFDKLFENYQVFYYFVDSQYFDEVVRNKINLYELQVFKGFKENGLIVNGKVFR